MSVHIHIEQLSRLIGAADRQIAGEVHPVSRPGPTPDFHPTAGIAESQVVAAVVVDVSQIHPGTAAYARRGQVAVVQGKVPRSISQINGTVLVGNGQVGVPIAVHIAEDKVHLRASPQEAEGLHPGAVPLVEVDVDSGTAAEGDGAHIQVAIVIHIGKIGAEHAPGLAVCGQAVVPGNPVVSRPIAQGHLKQLIAKVVSGIIMVHPVAHVHIAVAVHVAQGHTAVAKVAVHKYRPVAGSIAEPDHDTVLVCVDVGRTVVADGNQVEMAVAVHITHLHLGAARFQLGGRQAVGRFDIGQGMDCGVRTRAGRGGEESGRQNQPQDQDDNDHSTHRSPPKESDCGPASL